MDSNFPLDDGARASPSVARNTGPILDVLRAHLPHNCTVLEIASGTGEHAVAALKALPGLDWTPTDPDPEARQSIEAWRTHSGLEGLKSPMDLDVTDSATWPQTTFQAVICINMIHISPWEATVGLMQGAAKALTNPGGLLFLYGPYRLADQPLAPSNEDFDISLKARNPAWGLRAFEDVVDEAKKNGLAFTLKKDMPANNLVLLFRRV